MSKGGFIIGGNDFFRGYPNEDKYQEWYAIDDLSVYDGLPWVDTTI